MLFISIHSRKFLISFEKLMVNLITLTFYDTKMRGLYDVTVMIILCLY